MGRRCPESTSLHIALSVVKDFLDLHPDMQIDLVLFSDKATKAGRSLYPQLAEFIDSEWLVKVMDKVRAFEKETTE